MFGRLVMGSPSLYGRIAARQAGDCQPPAEYWQIAGATCDSKVMSKSGRQTFIPALSYKDPLAALEWLEKAFGFERSMLIMGRSGVYRADEFHAEMKFGNGVVMIGGEWTEHHRSPRSAGGVMTQTVHVHLDEDIDAHCARARAAGAKIVAEPADQFYGDRTYRAADPEGHVWSIGQTRRQVSREDAEKASDLKIEGWI